MLPPVCIISMPDSTRREKCVTSWASVFPVVNVFEAINGKHIDVTDSRLSVDLTDRIRSMNSFSKLSWNDDGNYIRSKPAIGCALSHIEVWKMVISTQTPMIVVEDDTVLRPTSASLIHDSIADEDLVFLITRVVHKRLVRNQRNFWGMNAYYVSPRAAEILVQYAFPLNMHIDRYIHMLAMRLNLNWSISNPSIPYYLYGKSTLEHSYGPFVRSVVGIVVVVSIITSVALVFKKCSRCYQCTQH